MTSQKALDISWVQDGSPGECRMGVRDVCRMVPYNNHPGPSYCLRLSVMSVPEPPSGAGISAYPGCIDCQLICQIAIS